MISIIIPTLQKRVDILEKLVKSLNSDDSVGEIIVIDNANKPLNFYCEKMRVITPEGNIYVNPAWNLGVKEAKYDIVGLLNDDIVISEKFCGRLENIFPENAGIVGYTSESIDEGEAKPEVSEIILKKTDFIIFGFGIAMFFKKDLYSQIPEDLKILYGDWYIFYECKKRGFTNYKILGQKISHIGSLTSSSKSLNPIIECDKKVYKKITLKPWDYIFSIHEYADCIRLRLFGMNLRIYNKKNKE